MPYKNFYKVLPHLSFNNNTQHYYGGDAFDARKIVGNTLNWATTTNTVTSGSHAAPTYSSGTVFTKPVSDNTTMNFHAAESSLSTSSSNDCAFPVQSWNATHDPALRAAIFFEWGVDFAYFGSEAQADGNVWPAQSLIMLAVFGLYTAYGFDNTDHD